MSKYLSIPEGDSKAFKEDIKLPEIVVKNPKVEIPKPTLFIPVEI